MKPFRIHSLLFTKLIQAPSIFPFSSQRCIPLCTMSNRSTRPSHFFDDVVPGKSAVYDHALKFQRPTTVKWKPLLENTASFIGSVARELMPVNSSDGDFGVHTALQVRRSNQPNSSFFWLHLMMWGDVAEVASQHLKPNDYIYVSGCLLSYSRHDDSGNLQVHHKLNVKKIEYVAQRQDYDDHKKRKSMEAEDVIQNDRNRLYLWQVFFSNPNEWWDQRKRKFNPKQPDFKHKDTGETLWLSKHDPPWIKRELELLDSQMAAGFAGRRSRVSNWVYDE